MTGIQKSISADVVIDMMDAIERMDIARNDWLDKAPPALRNAYLEQERKIRERLRNKILYGNEEGIKHE